MHKVPGYNAAVEKSRLQCLMATNGLSDTYDTPPPEQKPVLVSKEPEELDEVAELVEEIKERRAWLSDMMSMGRGAAFKPRIDFEVKEVSDLEASA